MLQELLILLVGLDTGDVPVRAVILLDIGVNEPQQQIQIRQRLRSVLLESCGPPLGIEHIILIPRLILIEFQFGEQLGILFLFEQSVNILPHVADGLLRGRAVIYLKCQGMLNLLAEGS